MSANHPPIPCIPSKWAAPAVWSLHGGYQLYKELIKEEGGHSVLILIVNSYFC